MASSPYIRALRARIGRGLVLLPSVAAVIHDPDGRLLLQRKPGAEGWSLPAGGIEPGESPEDALRREVLEEIGRAVRTARLLDVVGGKAYRHSDPNGDRLSFASAVTFWEARGLALPSPADVAQKNGSKEPSALKAQIEELEGKLKV